jgi:formylmethanofuran dehydrogenase subunit B
MKIEAVACPFCGALCDDINITVENNQIVSIEEACTLGVNKFMSTSGRETPKPFIRNGDIKYVKVDKAIEEAAKILSNSRKPLIYGFSSTNCEAHSKGIELAERLGGIVDCTSSVCHGPTIIAVQEVGYPSVTLGEVKNRADLVIYWGSNAMHAHPRHFSRYTHFSRGRFRERGKIDRKLIVMDIRETETAKLADKFVKIPPNRDYEVLNALRTILNKGDVEKEEVGGVSKEDLKGIVEMMKSCQFGVVFFGMGLTMSYGKHRNIIEAISLVRDLNRFTKFSIIPMRGHYNVTGFNEVCSWQTGYPYAVDFSKGYPWYNPGETDSNSVLQNEEVDAALIIASDPVAHFPRSSIRYLATIPVVVIDPFESLTSRIARVFIPSTVAGVETGGSAYRMDCVPLRLTKVLNPPQGVLTDEEILDRILQKIDKFS